jgi:hypothetical protein
MTVYLVSVASWVQAVARRAPGSADMRAALAALYWSQGKEAEAESEWEYACNRVTGEGRTLYFFSLAPPQGAYGPEYSFSFLGTAWRMVALHHAGAVFLLYDIGDKQTHPARAYPSTATPLAINASNACYSPIHTLSTHSLDHPAAEDG